MQSTISIIDDDEGILSALSICLRSAGYTVNTYSSGADFLSESGTFNASCLLIDVRMPGVDGIKVLEELNNRRNPPPAIMMTGQGDIATAVTAMKLGAVDFIEKPFEEFQILEKIEDVIRNSSEFSNNGKHAGASDTVTSLLTPRERDILNHILLGKSNKIIAFDLSISQRTVENHRSNIMRKSGAKNTADLIRMSLT